MTESVQNYQIGERLAEPFPADEVQFRAGAVSGTRCLARPHKGGAPTRPPVERFWEKVNKRGPKHPKLGRCWQWVAGGNPAGYGLFNRSSTKKPLSTLAHRWSWEFHFGQIVDNLCVLHSCDNRRCVNPKHLFLGTRTDNAVDKVAKGRQGALKGIDHPKVKLSELQVLQIRKRFSNGEANKSHLAREFRVGHTTIRAIISGKNWKHLLSEEK